MEGVKKTPLMLGYFKGGEYANARVDSSYAKCPMYLLYHCTLLLLVSIKNVTFIDDIQINLDLKLTNSL